MKKRIVTTIVALCIGWFSNAYATEERPYQWGVFVTNNADESTKSKLGSQVIKFTISKNSGSPSVIAFMKNMDTGESGYVGDQIKDVEIQDGGVLRFEFVDIGGCRINEDDNLNDENYILRCTKLLIDEMEKDKDGGFSIPVRENDFAIRKVE
uniref:Uncharacterized protein n=1 Tax=Candidatus Kentrum sp. TC TaxID=2126339 RepID=A0A450YLL1_9GAMM|nr:MAG: hypothetical protein BECKTC1821E_GA0114239_101845 [Candidatus Kentron sp. TC]